MEKPPNENAGYGEVLGVFVSPRETKQAHTEPQRHEGSRKKYAHVDLSCGLIRMRHVLLFVSVRIRHCEDFLDSPRLALLK